MSEAIALIAPPAISSRASLVTYPTVSDDDHTPVKVVGLNL